MSGRLLKYYKTDGDEAILAIQRYWESLGIQLDEAQSELSSSDYEFLCLYLKEMMSKVQVDDRIKD